MNRPRGLALPPNGSRVPANNSFPPNNPQLPTTIPLSDAVNYGNFDNDFGPEVTPLNLSAALQNIADFEALQHDDSGAGSRQEAPHSLDSFGPVPPFGPLRDLPSFDSGHYDGFPDPFDEFTHPPSPGSSGDFNFGFDTSGAPDVAGPGLSEEPAGEISAGNADPKSFRMESDSCDGSPDGDAKKEDQSSIDSKFVQPMGQQPDSRSPGIDPQLSSSHFNVPQRATNPQSSPQADGSNDVSPSNGRGPSGLDEDNRGCNEESSKQCEHKTDKADCPRPGRYVEGKFDRKKLCKRHGDQWETKNAGPPIWRPMVISAEAAMAVIRPDIQQPAVYRRQGYHDPTLHADRDGHVHWTVRFHEAAMTPWVGEGADHADPYRLLTHQRTFSEKAANPAHAKEYCEAMIVARMSLLFSIAQRFHLGGPPIYCIGGDNSGYPEDTDLTFLGRLQSMEEKLKANKRVVMDVIEGRGVEAFVRNPRDFDKRKTLNKKGNTTRQQRNLGTQPITTEQSREPSVGLGEAGPAPRSEDGEATSSVPTAAPKAKTAAPKRKRAAQQETDDDLNGRTQKASPAPRKKRAPRKPPLTPAASSQLPIVSHSPQQRAPSFGPISQDRRRFYGPPEDPFDHRHANVQQVPPHAVTRESQAAGGLSASSTPQYCYPGVAGLAEQQFQYPPPQSGGSLTAYHVLPPQPPRMNRAEQHLHSPLPHPWPAAQQYTPELLGQPAMEYRTMIHGLDMAFGHHGANREVLRTRVAAIPTATGSPAPEEPGKQQRSLPQGRQQGHSEMDHGHSDSPAPFWIGRTRYGNMADFIAKTGGG